MKIASSLTALATIVATPAFAEMDYMSFSGNGFFNVNGGYPPGFSIDADVQGHLGSFVGGFDVRAYGDGFVFGNIELGYQINENLVVSVRNFFMNGSFHGNPALELNWSDADTMLGFYATADGGIDGSVYGWQDFANGSFVGLRSWFYEGSGFHSGQFLGGTQFGDTSVAGSLSFWPSATSYILAINHDVSEPMSLGVAIAGSSNIPNQNYALGIDYDLGPSTSISANYSFPSDNPSDGSIGISVVFAQGKPSTAAGRREQNLLNHMGALWVRMDD